MNSLQSKKAAVFNTAGYYNASSCFRYGDHTTASQSCSVTFKNKFYVFGGAHRYHSHSERTQLSILNGNRLERIDNLRFDHKDKISCSLFFDTNFCWNHLKVWNMCQCQRSTYLFLLWRLNCKRKTFLSVHWGNKICFQWADKGCGILNDKSDELLWLPNLKACRGFPSMAQHQLRPYSRRRQKNAGNGSFLQFQRGNT